MTFDLRRALRRIKPHRFTAPLVRRARVDLPFLSGSPVGGPELLLDTCVYIDVLQNRAPEDVQALLQVRTLNHVSVCVAELVHAFGRLDPRRPGTEAALAAMEHVVAAVPAHRLTAPAAATVAEAGILAGLLFRLGGWQPGQEVAALNDATLYLHAAATGRLVLTRNVSDFDLLNQVLPDGRVLFYERSG